MELLLENNTAVAHYVVCRDVFHVSFAFPSSQSCPFNEEFFVQIVTSDHCHQQRTPEAAVFAIVHVLVVIHHMAGLGSVEVYFVCLHESFKFNSVLRRDELGVDEVVVQVIVNVGLMEPVGWVHRFAS